MPADPFSTYSHALGAIAAAFFGIFLIRKGLRRTSNKWGATAALAVFVLSAIVLLSASALYHALPPLARARAVFLRLDHAAIFVLIAGTFTPLHAIAFRGFMRWGILAFIWACAAVGIAIKTVFFHDIPYWVGVTAYLAMGWVGALSMALLWRRDSLRRVSPLILGGLAYTAGALCEFTNQPNPWPGVINAHEVFHVAVLVGLACMWMFIRRLAGTESAHEPTHPRPSAATSPTNALPQSSSLPPMPNA